MTTMVGRLSSVFTISVGGNLVESANIGDTVLYLDDVYDFNESGGYFTLDDGATQIQYDSVDPDSDTMALTDPLTDALDITDDEVYVAVYPLSYVKKGTVEFDDDDEGVTARVPLVLMGYLDEGVRDPFTEEQVLVSDASGEWEIIQVDDYILQSPESVGGDGNTIGAQLDYLNNTVIPFINSQISYLNDTALPGLASDLADANAAISGLNGLFPITETSISDGAITTPKMTANSINGDRITANTINANKIVANSIGASQISATSVWAAIVTANTIVADTVDASWVYAGTITGNQINGGTITGVTIQSSSGTAKVVIAPNAYLGSDAIALYGASSVAGYLYTANTSNLTVGAVSSLKLYANSGIALQGSDVTISPAVGGSGGNLTVTGDTHSGDVYVTNVPTTGSAANTYMGPAGRLFTSTSSRRFKKNIKSAELDLAPLMKVLVRTFNRKDAEDNGHPENHLYLGLIAEELHKLGLTWWVVYDVKGKPYSVDWNNVVAYLIRGHQDHEKRLQKAGI